MCLKMELHNHVVMTPSSNCSTNFNTIGQFNKCQIDLFKPTMKLKPTDTADANHLKAKILVWAASMKRRKMKDKIS